MSHVSNAPVNAVLSASDALARAAGAPGFRPLRPALETCPRCGAARMIAGPAPVACAACAAPARKAAA